ncbi:unnamed protein product [Closterium sp. NIES-65]|nr:unnamed protein product [Closterium sp. NIES-65]
MACIGAENACMDVDALFASCWEQNDSLTRFICSMIAAPRLAVSSWIRPCEQAAVEVLSVPVLPVIALLEEAASTDAEVETAAVAVAVTVDAPSVTAAVSSQAEEAEETENAEEVEKAEEPKEPKRKAYSFLELLAQEDSVASRTCSVDSVSKIDASSAKVAAWLGVKGGSEQGGKAESEAQQGGKEGAKASSGWCSLSRSESSCSSCSACLIHLSSDSSSCSSSAHSLCSSPTGLTKEVAGVKRGIGRGGFSSGKGHSLSTAYHFTDLVAAEEKTVKSAIGKGLSCNGKDWSMEVKGFGKVEGRIASNQLFGCDDGEEEEEHGSSKQSFRTLGTGTMCYMNQLYMDEH